MNRAMRRAATERHNYYNDRRVQQAMKTGSTRLVVDEKNMRATVIVEGEDVGTVSVRYEVCQTCQGRGTHVNPSIDADGLSLHEIEPKFAADYFSGRYDVCCAECQGKRVVARPDPDQESDAMQQYWEAVEADRAYALERAAERAMGA